MEPITQSIAQHLSVMTPDEFNYQDLWDITALEQVKIIPVPENGYENYLLLTVGAIGISMAVMGVMMIPILPFAAVFIAGIMFMQSIAMNIAGAPNQITQNIGKWWRNVLFLSLGGIWELLHANERDVKDALQGE